MRNFKNHYLRKGILHEGSGGNMVEHESEPNNVDNSVIQNNQILIANKEDIIFDILLEKTDSYGYGFYLKCSSKCIYVHSFHNEANGENLKYVKVNDILLEIDGFKFNSLVEVYSYLSSDMASSSKIRLFRFLRNPSKAFISHNLNKPYNFNNKIIFSRNNSISELESMIADLVERNRLLVSEIVNQKCIIIKKEIELKSLKEEFATYKLENQNSKISINSLFPKIVNLGNNAIDSSSKALSVIRGTGTKNSMMEEVLKDSQQKDIDDIKKEYEEKILRLRIENEEKLKHLLNRMNKKCAMLEKVVKIEKKEIEDDTVPDIP